MGRLYLPARGPRSGLPPFLGNKADGSPQVQAWRLAAVYKQAEAALSDRAGAHRRAMWGAPGTRSPRRPCGRRRRCGRGGRTCESCLRPRRRLQSQGTSLRRPDGTARCDPGTAVRFWSARTLPDGGVADGRPSHWLRARPSRPLRRRLLGTRRAAHVRETAGQLPWPPHAAARRIARSTRGLVSRRLAASSGATAESQSPTCRSA